MKFEVFKRNQSFEKPVCEIKQSGNLKVVR